MAVPPVGSRNTKHLTLELKEQIDFSKILSSASPGISACPRNFDFILLLLSLFIFVPITEHLVAAAMTEYWVSQGNKWCDFCKIYISNNPATIRNHELGQRHKDNVVKKLDDMRKDKVAKEKELKEAARVVQQIEAKAQRSYQKDVASQKEARESHALDSQTGNGDEKWECDSSTGYYRSEDTGLLYDPNSGFYYSDTLGKWVTQEEANKSVLLKKPQIRKATPATEKKGGAPGPVVSGSLNTMKMAKGAAPSSLAVKRKRPEEKKPKVVSKEEEAALKAREAAKKRMEAREKPLLGLYSGNWKS